MKSNAVYILARNTYSSPLPQFFMGVRVLQGAVPVFPKIKQVPYFFPGRDIYSLDES